MHKRLMLLLAISIQILLIASCGSISDNGTTSLFETASVSFITTTVSSSSTISAKPNTDDSASAATLTITVVPYPGFSGAISPFTVRSMQYVYTQTSGGSATFTVPDVNFTTNLSFKPILASGFVKDQLVDLGYTTGTPWTFSVQATYTVVEDYSGKTRNYSVPLGTVRFI